MTETPWRSATFRKSSFSGGQNGSCVEIAHSQSLIGIRDSKNPTGPVLQLPTGPTFVTAVRTGLLHR